MKSLKVLDVTLRDGGCVNDFNFGQFNMERILQAQEASGVDFIELGYIDQNKGTEAGRTQYINEKVIYQHFIKGKKPGVTYVAMMDYGKFDVTKLEERHHVIISELIPQYLQADINDETAARFKELKGI